MTKSYDEDPLKEYLESLNRFPDLLLAVHTMESIWRYRNRREERMFLAERRVLVLEAELRSAAMLAAWTAKRYKKQSSVIRTLKRKLHERQVETGEIEDESQAEPGDEESYGGY